MSLPRRLCSRRQSSKPSPTEGGGGAAAGDEAADADQDRPSPAQRFLCPPQPGLPLFAVEEAVGDRVSDPAAEPGAEVVVDEGAERDRWDDRPDQQVPWAASTETVITIVSEGISGKRTRLPTPDRVGLPIVERVIKGPCQPY
jgi:hypothetical protein